MSVFDKFGFFIFANNGSDGTDDSAEESNHENRALTMMYLHYENYGSIRKEFEYVKKGSIISCTYGSSLSLIDSLRDHGVYYDDDGSPVLICTDCKAEENIYSFGICLCPKEKYKPLPERIQVTVKDGATSYITGEKCVPVLNIIWNQSTTSAMIKEGTYSPALTTAGTLSCIYGGIIKVLEVAKTGSTNVYITLSQMLNQTITWSFREITKYDMSTSLPTYVDPNNGRDITQADVDEINRVMGVYEINKNVERVCHFLSQCHGETDAGFLPIEQYSTGSPLTDPKFKKYEKIGNTLGNEHGSGDGYKYRGAGAIQLTGKTSYKIFSEYMGDPKILSDGALYVGQYYFWEAAGFFWSIYKPNSANYSVSNLSGDQWPIYISQSGNDKFDLNGKCDAGATVYDITDIVYGDVTDADSHLSKREDSYNYYKSVILN